MCAPRLWIAAVLFVAGTQIATTPASAQSLQASPAVDPIAVYVAEAARRFAIPETWIYAVMRVESAGDPHAISPQGAMGLMQIMPATWTSLRARYGLGGDIYDRHDNIMAGAAYLREMYDRYGALGFLAAYNAGPGRYDDYLETGRPLPAETVAYVGKLAAIVGGPSADRTVAVAPDPLAWTRASLFTARSDGSSSQHQDAADPTSDGPLDDGQTGNLAAVEPASTGLFAPLSGKSPR